MMRIITRWRYGQYACNGNCFDIDTLTTQAFVRFEQSGKIFAGALHERSAGNGPLIQLVSAVLATFDDPTHSTALARPESRTTHDAPQAFNACALFTVMLREAILSVADPLAPHRFGGHVTITTTAAGGRRSERCEANCSSGYLVYALEATLWAAGQRRASRRR